MEKKKSINTNLGITIILMFSALLVICSFLIIGYELNWDFGYPKGNSNYKSEILIDDNSIVDDDNMIDVTKNENSDYLLQVYNSRYKKNVDSFFKFDQYKFHIIVDKNLNSVSVDDKQIFKSDDKIYLVYLIQDILVIQVTNSNMDDKLFFIDVDGNVLKNIDNLSHNAVLVSKTDIKYFVENCNLNENEVYSLCEADSYIIRYLGENQLSESILDDQGNWTAAGITDCDMDVCVLYDNNNDLKLEYYSSIDEQIFNPALIINGQSVNLSGYRLSKVKFTNDNYLYIKLESGTGAGLLSSMLISDFSGNIINTLNEDSLKSGLNSYFIDLNGDNINYYAQKFGSDVRSVCESRIGTQTNSFIKNDSVVFIKDEYQYIGNGNISKINHIEKTFLEYMIDLTGYNNCEDALANIDSWENKDNFSKIYE